MALPSGGRGTPEVGARLVREEAGADQEERARDSLFKPVIDQLHNHTGVDFSLYKSNTIQRRISRRMVLNKCASLREYAALLKRSPRELDSLYSDVLISVTSFFRNPEVFDFLKRKVFPRLFGERRDDPVRVWVLGCSTGQEAYSMGMVLDEFFDRHSVNPKYQIFASDLNESLLAKARTGLYTKTVVQDVSPERLRRFFTEEDGGYRICKSLRDSIVFARQNLIHDPPFSRMDLITCRNVLIYLDSRVHRRIIPVFHYALKPNGFLVLGSSESVGPFNDLFEPIDRKHKVFIKKPAPTPPLHLGAVVKAPKEKKSREVKEPPVGVLTHAEVNIQREADRVALNRYVPPSVLVNANMHVLYFRGDTSPYLTPPTGRATFNLLHMAKDGLLPSLRGVLTRSVKQHKAARLENVEWFERGKSRRTSIEVVPLANAKERCYLVFFEERSKGNPARVHDQESRETEPLSKNGGTVRQWRSKVAQLERALAESRDYLQSVQEQYEAVNEELQAANEEATSANEELQSTNEELETSKEELESTNEELNTVNDELASRNSELTLANSDLQNIYVNVNMAVILFSRDLTVRRFTKPAEKLFNLVDSDIGRSMSTIRPNLEIDDLERLLVEVIESVSLREREVRSRSGQWYMLRARPYFTQDRKVDGVVLVAVDVDQLKRSEQEAKSQRQHAEAILHSTPVPLLVLDTDLKVDFANEAFYQLFKTAREETERRSIFRLGNGQWNIPQLRTFLEEIIPRNSFIKNFEVSHEFPVIGQRTLFLSARRLDSEPPVGYRILIALDDYTDQIQAQQSVRLSELRFRRLFETAPDGILLVDPGSRKIRASNPFVRELLGRPADEIAGRELWQIGILQDKPTRDAFFRELKEKGVARPDRFTIQSAAGEERHLELIANRYSENAQEVIQCNLRDVTERQRSILALRKAKEELEEANRTLEHRVFERTAALETVNAHLRDLSARLIGAQEDERQRIARELHDNIGAMLVALKLQLHAIALESPEEHARIEALVTDLTGQIRQLSLDLHPHVLDDLGLKAALQWHIQSYEQRTKISVEFDAGRLAATRLPPQMEITIFRLVQEGLTNVARHAEASEAEVRLDQTAEGITLEIKDEGKGFSPDKIGGKTSLGITGMRERVLLLDGTFEIVSSPGHGTRIKVSLPIDRKDQG
jgi:PAS domain S-box-containing protein